MATTTGPGMVTSNVAGSTYAALTPEQERWNNQQRERAFARQDEQRAEREAEQAKLEQDAKMKAAYSKIYAPYAQSIWDMNQGQIGGIDPRRVSGNPQNGTSVYKKTGPYPGQQPYEYRPDTNMPADAYQQQLDAAYEMWKAGKIIGIGDTKVQGHGGRIYGGASATEGGKGSY